MTPSIPPSAHIIQMGEFIKSICAVSCPDSAIELFSAEILLSCLNRQTTKKSISQHGYEFWLNYGTAVSNNISMLIELIVDTSIIHE